MLVYLLKFYQKILLIIGISWYNFLNKIIYQILLKFLTLYKILQK